MSRTAEIAEIAEMFAALDGRDRLADAIERIRESVGHGYRGYTTFKCRCEVCRAANAEYMRTYAKLRRRRDSSYRAQRARYEARRRAGKHSATSMAAR